MFLSNPKLIEEYRTPGGRKGFIFEGADGERVVLCFDKGKVPEKWTPLIPATDPDHFWAAARINQQAASQTYNLAAQQNALGPYGYQGQVTDVGRGGAVSQLFGGIFR